MLEEGFARRGGRPEGWDLAAHVPVVVADDVQAARDFLKPLLALYVGGMGAKGQNFYNRLAQRYGFEEAAAKVQDLFLEGKKGEAAAAVPDALVDEVALVGDRARIADRVAAFRELRRHDARAAGAAAGGAAAARRARAERSGAGST